MPVAGRLMTPCVNSLNKWAGYPPSEDRLHGGSGRVNGWHSPGHLSPAAWSVLGDTGTAGTSPRDVAATPSAVQCGHCAYDPLGAEGGHPTLRTLCLSDGSHKAGDSSQKQCSEALYKVTRKLI